MKKLALILCLGLCLDLQAQKPYIPTMEDYCKQFSESKDWTVSCVSRLQVDTDLVVDALLLRVETVEQWDRLLAQFHIKPLQLLDPATQQLRMGWSRTWRRDLKKDAYDHTPGERAVLTFFSTATATVLLIFPSSTADEERLLGFFLAKYANQNPLQIMRPEVAYDPESREFNHVWAEPILSWSTRTQMYVFPIERKYRTIKRGVP